MTLKLVEELPPKLKVEPQRKKKGLLLITSL